MDRQFNHNDGLWNLLDTLCRPADRHQYVAECCAWTVCPIFSAPAVGRIVDFRIPPMAREYIQQRTGQDGSDWFILKPIVAGPGDTVDTMGGWLIINGRRIASMPSQFDHDGRILPIWKAARTLGPDEFFVFSDRIPNSFDSRCYGPIRRSQIDAVRRALMTW